ncbi:MAG: phage head-tail connector protein [Anaerolineaceae bacterium]|nr:phage head-tail connector protein [Anaerolineaceae bacterium]
MALSLVTGASAEPITTAEAKLHLRVDHNTEDDYIDSLVKLARRHVELIGNLALITQTWDLMMDAWPGRVFPMPLYPLASVVSIKWKDQDGSETTIDSSNYVVDTASRPGRVALVSDYSWPGDSLYPIGAIAMRFTTGFGLAVDVPEKYKHAMLLLIAHYYENREAVHAGVGANVQMLPMGVTSLLADDIRWVS